MTDSKVFFKGNVDIDSCKRSWMEQRNEADYFKVLEEKVGLLITQIGSLKNEREKLREKILQQQKTISDLSGEMEKIRGSRDKVKERIINILNKIEQMDI
jgi:hemerythrin superfamily protein